MSIRIPAPTPSATCTPTPRPRTYYVADSNIFMDRVEGGPAQRNRIDHNFLANPDIILWVPHTVDVELSRSPSVTQVARRRGVPTGATILSIPDADTSGLAIRSLISRRFDLGDLVIIHTARERAVPLLTTNRRMGQQIRSHAGRRALWGTVPLVIP